MDIKLYNTLTRGKEVFKPIKKGEVRMYTCGPTVYWYQHIGNMRSYIFSDILRRVLEYNGFKVKQVMNITDVGHLTSDGDEGEDKMEKAAVKEGKKASEIAENYLNIFQEDMKKLNILYPWKWPKASGHIKEQIELIEKLEKKGYTYKTSDGIYFNASKFKNYGKLAKLNLEGQKAGKRVNFGEKKSKNDFALWKFSEREGIRQQEWNSPWGVGFPGWHIECSAMSMKYLGERFDIHTGGEDHISIHHTNEIAQSESITGKKFVNYWLHGAFLKFKGEKVSKSKGGLYTISELEKIGYGALDFRYLLLMTHYRKALNFTLENLDSAKNAFDKLRRRVADLRNEERKGPDRTKEYEEEFLRAVNDDLNMPRALKVLWKVIDDFDFSPKEKVKLLERFDSVLGLGVKNMKEKKDIIPKKVLDLIEKRELLRKEKKWAEADIVRERIKEEGYLVEDLPDGARVEKT